MKVPDVRVFTFFLFFYPPSTNFMLTNVVFAWISNRHDASIDTQHHLHGSTYDLMWPWPEVKYWPNHSRSSCIGFNAPWREKHDGAQIMPLALLLKKLSLKNLQQLFRPLLTSIAQTVVVNSILTTCWRKSSSRAMEWFSPSLLPIIVSEIMAHFRRNKNFAKFSIS